jgi:hypothetical protein
MLGNKVIKKKSMNKELTLKVSKNEDNARIFVEFSSEDGKLVLQKSFQDTISGREDAEEFQKSIKTLKDLRKYFGLK